jgi:hypothetical protein
MAIRFRLPATKNQIPDVEADFKSLYTCAAKKKGQRNGKGRTPTSDNNRTLTTEDGTMCRNIRTLFNFDPPVTPEEVRAASLQFVRKITGFHHPSKANEAAFAAAIDEIARASTRLLTSLETTAPHRNREVEAAKARARAADRFGAASS